MIMRYFIFRRKPSVFRTEGFKVSLRWGDRMGRQHIFLSYDIIILYQENACSIREGGEAY